MGRVTAAVAVALLQLVAAAPCGASPDWAWFRSVSTGTAWWVTQGKGDVIMSDGRFEAILRDDDSQFVRLTLRGSVSGGLVKARVTVESSDVPEFQVSGRLRRVCGEAKGGREILILTNGLSAIGLVRELSPSVPCKPVA